MSEIIQQPTEKVVFEFQHTDEQGNPIIDPRTGKQAFTNLTGNNWEEIAQKMKGSYLNVSRAYARSKNYKPVPKAADTAPAQLTAEEERQAAVDLQDPTKARAAARKLVGADQTEEELKVAREKQDKADAARAAYQFMAAHLNDYYACQANSVIMSKYINENGLDPRVADNYEIAFNAVQDQLAQKAAPPVVTPAPAPESLKPASGGLQPGMLSGQRPSPKKTGKFSYSKKEIKDMPRAEYHKLLRVPGFEDYVNSLYAPK